MITRRAFGKLISAFAALAVIPAPVARAVEAWTTEPDRLIMGPTVLYDGVVIGHASDIRLDVHTMHIPCFGTSQVITTGVSATLRFDLPDAAWLMMEPGDRCTIAVDYGPDVEARVTVPNARVDSLVQSSHDGAQLRVVALPSDDARGEFLRW